MKFKEIMNKYYGVADLFGKNGKDVQKKAWKAVGIATVIYGISIGLCALVDSVFTDKHQKELDNEINEINNREDIGSNEKFDMKIEARERFDKHNHIVTGLLGSAIGLASSALMLKVQEKK